MLWVVFKLRWIHRGRGRPAIDIPEDQLVMLLEHHFTVTDIAHMLHVSPRTIRRRVLQYGLESTTMYSDMSDDQFDEITVQYVHTHPYCGRRSYQGFLRSAGVRIQQTRVRESLRRIDQRGMERRFRLALIAGGIVCACQIVSGTSMATTSSFGGE